MSAPSPGRRCSAARAAHGDARSSARARSSGWRATRRAWPLPKIFRMTKGGKLIEGIFKGETINTPSMLCVEDCIFALEWARAARRPRRPDRPRRCQCRGARRAGCSGTPGSSISPAIRRSARTPRLPASSPTRVGDERGASGAGQEDGGQLLEAEGAAYDIAAYRDAPPGLRIWCGATVETADIEALGPWLDWAFEEASNPEPLCVIPAKAGIPAASDQSPSPAEIPASAGMTRENDRHAQSPDLRQDGSHAPPRSSATAASRSTRSPASRQDELKAIIGDYDGLAVRSARPRSTPTCWRPRRNLKVIGRAGIGVDNVDIPAAIRARHRRDEHAVRQFDHHRRACHRPDVRARPRAARRPMQSTQAGKWEKNRFMGVELTGKTLGLIGCGNIGSIVADRAHRPAR